MYYYRYNLSTYNSWINEEGFKTVGKALDTALKNAMDKVGKEPAKGAGAVIESIEIQTKVYK